jgi:hypothetical protein
MPSTSVLDKFNGQLMHHMGAPYPERLWKPSTLQDAKNLVVRRQLASLRSIFPRSELLTAIGSVDQLEDVLGVFRLFCTLFI